MGLFDEILGNDIKVDNNKVYIEPKSILPIVRSLDPRPDLESDSQIWTQLLAVAKDMDESLEFYGIMLGFRAMGTRLILPTEAPYRGEYRMRGQADPTGNKHWKSMNDYIAAAVGYLGPADNPNRYGAMLTELLGKLSFKKVA